MGDRRESLDERGPLLISEEDSDETPLSGLSVYRVVILVTIFISNVIAFMCLSILPPFFPALAKEKGMPMWVTGLVFGTYSLVGIFISALAGKLTGIVGPKFLFVAGNFIGGTCTALTGLLAYIPTNEGDTRLFTTFSFLIQIVLSLGYSSSYTATFVVATTTFPQSASLVMGSLEASVGVGLLAGPALGAVLYNIGGFSLPFYVIGAMMVGMLPVYCCVIPSSDPEGPQRVQSSDSVPMKTLLSIPVVFVIFVSVSVRAFLWESFDPILQPHLSQFDFNPSQAALVFMLVSGMYALISPVIGRIADRMENSTPLIIMGFSAMTGGFLLIGPSPFIPGLNLYKAVWLNMLSLIIIGIGASLASVPTFNRIFATSQNAGIEQSVSLHGAVAGLWTAFFSLGKSLGPIFSGVVAQYFGFVWTTTIMAVFTLIMALTLVGVYLYERRMCFPVGRSSAGRSKF